MRRQSVWCIWILCALLVVASVDATPDPPALDQHIAAVKVPSPSGFAVQSLSWNHSSLTVFQAREFAFAGDTEPDCPASFLAQVGQAADSSPPCLIESL
jgi:hypothetical protein